MQMNKFNTKKRKFCLVHELNNKNNKYNNE